MFGEIDEWHGTDGVARTQDTVRDDVVKVTGASAAGAVDLRRDAVCRAHCIILYVEMGCRRSHRQRDSDSDIDVSGRRKGRPPRG